MSLYFFAGRPAGSEAFAAVTPSALAERSADEAPKNSLRFIPIFSPPAGTNYLRRCWISSQAAHALSVTLRWCRRTSNTLGLRLSIRGIPLQTRAILWRLTIAVLLHDTDILEFHPDGTIELSNGGD
jgi:hypothetical protein